MQRNLNSTEREIVRKISLHLPRSQAESLLLDLSRAKAHVVSGDYSRILFKIDGHNAAYNGQEAYPIEARMNDADGSELTVILYKDAHGHLYELEFVRWDGKPVLNPDISSLRVGSELLG